MSRIASFVSWALATALITGCGQPSTGVSVHGHVSYKGEPIPNAALTFFPEHGRAIPAATNESADYAIELLPGPYDVVLSVSVKLPPGWKEGDTIPPPEIVLPAEYTTRVKTPLKTTVSTESQGPTDFVLK